MNSSPVPFLKLAVDNTAAAPAARRSLTALPTQQKVEDDVTCYEEGAFTSYKATILRESADTAALDNVQLTPGHILQQKASRRLLAEEMSLRSGAHLRVADGKLGATSPDGCPLALPSGVEAMLDSASGVVLERGIPNEGHCTQQIDLDGTTRFITHQNSMVTTVTIEPDGNASIETRPNNGRAPAVVQRGQASETADGKISILTREASPSLVVVQPFIRRDYYVGAPAASGRALPAGVVRVPREPYQRETTETTTRGGPNSVFSSIRQIVEQLRPDADLVEDLPLQTGQVRVFPSESRVVKIEVTFSNGRTLETSEARLSGKMLSLSRDGFRQNIMDDGTTLFEHRTMTSDGEVQSYQYKIDRSGRAAVRPDNSLTWQRGLAARELEDGRLLIEGKVGFTALISPLAPLSLYTSLSA